MDPQIFLILNKLTKEQLAVFEYLAGPCWTILTKRQTRSISVEYDQFVTALASAIYEKTLQVDIDTLKK